MEQGYRHVILPSRSKLVQAGGGGRCAPYGVLRAQRSHSPISHGNFKIHVTHDPQFTSRNYVHNCTEQEVLTKPNLSAFGNFS